jgi:octaprenyl-diphosphate synthase
MNRAGFGQGGENSMAMAIKSETSAPATGRGARLNGQARPASVMDRVAFQALIADDLAAVERAISGTADVPVALLSRTLQLVLGPGGKRLRPTLVLLASHGNARASLQRRVDLAAAAELLHTATLVHDDVIDLAESRRGSPTVNHVFTNALAVLTGDFLFGQSGALVAGLGSPEIMRVFSWAVMEVVQGEMLRPTVGPDLDATERDYLAKIRGKTAALLAMACETGAMLDSDDEVARLAHHRYGMSLGMAFQIVDDILDFTATEAELGKPVGHDLEQGTITLPSLLYLREHPGDTIVRAHFTGGEGLGEGATLEAVAAVRASGAIEGARGRASAYVREAIGHLSMLPPSPSRDALEALASFVISRHD